MAKPSSSMRELARQLHAASRVESDQHVHEAVLVTEKLRLSLARFAGTEGFAALLRRALALAREDVPLLAGVKINAKGSLEGLEEGGARSKRGKKTAEDVDAALAITAHLLTLLITFIGESLALQLVREGWPDLTFEAGVE